MTDGRMRVVILAAGYGTRLAGATGGQQPKCLLDVQGRPVLAYILANAASFGFSDFTIVSNSHYYNQIDTWFSRNLMFGNARVLDNGTTCVNDRLGKTGDLAFALKSLGKADDLLVLSGDTIADWNLDYLYERFLEYGETTLGLLDLGKPRFVKAGILKCSGASGGLVLDYQASPAEPKSSLIDGLCYMIPAHRLQLVHECNEKEGGHGHLLRYFIREGCYGFVAAKYAYHIDTPELLQKVRQSQIPCGT